MQTADSGSSRRDTYKNKGNSNNKRYNSNGMDIKGVGNVARERRNNLQGKCMIFDLSFQIFNTVVLSIVIILMIWLHLRI